MMAGGGINLVRDLLDAQLVDRDERMIGRVDDIVLDVREGRPPRVAAMEVGAITLARRLHPRLGRWLRYVAVRWLPVSLRPVRLPLTLFRDVGVDIELDVDEATTRRLLRLEHWLRRHVVGHLPGGGEK
jgi:sporulation protein YlmC with PRC-barrel domain